MLQGMSSLLAAAAAAAVLSLPRAAMASSLSFANDYEVPSSLASLVAASSSSGACVTPQSFSAELFQVWTPDAGNANPTELSFNYRDPQTDVATRCVLNASSVAVPSQGTARYPCDDAAVEFIWTAGTESGERMVGGKLTVMEKVCQGSTGSTTWVVSGSAAPTLNCVATPSNSSYGAGQDCLSQATTMIGNFTSIEPGE